MIRINLMPKDDANTVLAVAGLNLAQINIKLVLAAVVISYGLKITLSSYLKDKYVEENKSVDILNKKEKELVKKASQHKDIEKKIKETIDEEEKLQERKKIIKDRLSNRKNPLRLMVYIAKNIPDNLWIEKMALTGNEIDIQGVTSTYRSIGVFINNLKNSVYFDKKFSFEGSETKINQKTGVRSEKFQILGKVVGYN